ncbi:CUB domain-containing protein [Caerostris extrusa]|uniref:CUB domain-containing protein n=1 Tax=Caerostris extrusa TaxID=172846 RepID=A0AAV4RAA7_CAEEX|nr:CUB domain-containing protein [Caerostris extrusa]
MRMKTFYILSSVLLFTKHHFCQETTTTLLPPSESIIEVTSAISNETTIRTSTASSSIKNVSPTTSSVPSRTVAAATECDQSWSSRDYDLVHPGFPSDYSNGMLCRYIIRKNSESVCGLEITFKRFDLETSAGCEKDFLAIGDERLCGHIPADSVVQYPFDEGSKHISIVFGTNDNITRSGFQILFQQISICEEDLNAIPAITPVHHREGGIRGTVRWNWTLWTSTSSTLLDALAATCSWTDTDSVALLLEDKEKM